MKRNKNTERLKKNNEVGFQVPKGYFESMENELFDKLDLTKSVLPEHLDSGFRVPEGYFDQEQAALKTLNTNRPKRVIKLFNKKLIGWSIAASVILFFGIQQLSEEAPSANLSEFSSEELFSWLESDALEMHAYDIAEAFDMQVFEDESDAFILDYVSESEIEEMLIEN